MCPCASPVHTVLYHIAGPSQWRKCTCATRALVFDFRPVGLWLSAHASAGARACVAAGFTAREIHRIAVRTYVWQLWEAILRLTTVFWWFLGMASYNCQTTVFLMGLKYFWKRRSCANQLFCLKWGFFLLNTRFLPLIHLRSFHWWIADAAAEFELFVFVGHWAHRLSGDFAPHNQSRQRCANNCLVWDDNVFTVFTECCLLMRFHIHHY